MKAGKKKRRETFVPYDYEKAFTKSIEDLHEYFIEHMLKPRCRCVYAMKEITSGGQFEVEIYPEFRSVTEVPLEGRVKRDNSKAQKNLNDKNARKYVVRLINHNFTNDDIWITLTYMAGEEPEDMAEAVKNMQRYIGRLNYQRKKRGLPNAKYIYITEYAPDAEIRWHHHLVMDGALDMDTVESVWKKGRRNETRRLHKDEYGLTGLATYITKEKNRRKGERRWNSSKNLKKPKVKKVHSKRLDGKAGTYKPIGRYVEGFVRNQEAIEHQMAKWYPEYAFTEASVHYNDYNKLFYIHVQMRRR